MGVKPVNNTPRARPAGFWHDLVTIAGRALRAIPREADNLAPALIFPVFFFAIVVGSLEGIASFAGVDNFRAFQIPVAIIFAVTGVSRAIALVA
ncbi:MAG: hypothetical protein ACE1ZC_05725 [Nitrososphaerales archaeon]